MSGPVITMCFIVLALVAFVAFLIWGALSMKAEGKNDGKYDGDPRIDEIEEEEDEDEDEVY